MEVCFHLFWEYRSGQNYFSSVLGISDAQPLKLPRSNSALKCEDLIMLVKYAVHKLQCYKLKIKTIHRFRNVFMLTVYLFSYIM